jgi:hypothetical protein
VSEKAGHQTSAESWGTGQYIFLFVSKESGIGKMAAWKLENLHRVAEFSSKEEC